MPAASPWTAFALGLFWAATSANSATAQTAPAPMVVVDRLPKRAIVTLGEFSPGQGVTTTLRLKNELGKPLRALSIETDCGCLRVDHDPEDSSDDGSLELVIELAASRKVGRIRRNVRVFFEQEPTSPLDIGLDTLVVSPISFASPQASLTSAADVVVIHGIKSSSGMEVLECVPTRGVCRVVAIEQTDNSFTVRAQPLISFGSASELFRLRYRSSDKPVASLIELPLEFRCAVPVRFFPSIAPIEFQAGFWQSTAKLVKAPGEPLDLEELNVSIERRDGSQWAKDDFRIEIQQFSAVLYIVRINCSPPAPTLRSDPPARLKVASPNGELLATLDFSSPVETKGK